MHLKKFILENTLTIQNKFNNRATNLQWWINRDHEGIYNEILEETKFLPATSLMTRRAYHVTQELKFIESCIHCNLKPRIFINYTEGYSEFCSRPCATKSKSRVEKTQKTNLERYGHVCTIHNKTINDKMKATNKKRYGVEYSTQSDNMKRKTKETKLERYGDENYNNIEKLKSTNLKNHGVEYNGQRMDVIAKICATNTKKIPQLRDRSWIIEQNKTKGINQIASELNVSQRAVWVWIEKHKIDAKSHKVKGVKEQKAIAKFIREELGIINIDYDTKKIITPKEIDIYLPDFKFGVELNGMYWHKEDKIKHLEKLNLCIDKDIKLIQFWDYEWLFKTDICKSIIKSNLGLNERIFARKCKIVELTVEEYRCFMNDHHLQGYAAASIKFGLQYNNEIVSCISFAKPRNKHSKIKYDWELVRYANKLNTNVIGGFSRLFKHCNLTNIISYCDKMRFTGTMYEQAGFKRIEDTQVGYLYFKGYIVKSREYLQNHKLAKNLTIYDINLSPKENIFNNGWRKIYNCGNSVWSYSS